MIRFLFVIFGRLAGGKVMFLFDVIGVWKYLLFMVVDLWFGMDI